MKKTFISAMVVTALAMLATSCSSELAGVETAQTNSESGMVPVTFNATQESDAPTSRTCFNSSYDHIHWETTDVVTVWDGYGKNQFSVCPSENPAYAALSGSVTASASYFTAVYPHSVGQNCTFTSNEESNAVINDLVIPNEQTATSNTYDPNAAIMTAISTNKTFNFKNVCAFLKITTDKAYKKIVVSVTNGNIAGTFNVTDYGSAPSLGVTVGKNEITLKSDQENGNIAKGTYFIAIAPGTVSGITVNCYSGETVDKKKNRSSEITFSRSTAYDLGDTKDYDAGPSN